MSTEFNSGTRQTGWSDRTPTSGTTFGSTGAGTDSKQEIVNEAKETVSTVANAARSQAESKIDQQKSRAAQTVSSFATALSSASQNLKEQEQNTIAPYLDQAAQRLERVADFIEHRDVGEMLEEVQGFARRNPAVVLGGAFVLGVLGARFLKSSSRSRYQGGTSQNLPARSPSWSANTSSSRNVL